jgi:hypothetical protein
MQGENMNFFKRAWLVATVVSLCGCAGGPAKRPPAVTAGAVTVSVLAELPKSSQFSTNVVPVGQSQYVLAQNQGGSIFLGPILGSMHVRQKTKDLARKNAQSVFDIDPAPIATAALAAARMPDAGAAAVFIVKPFVFAEHCTDGNFRFSLIYQVETRSASPWVGRYTYNLPTPIPDSRLAGLDEAGREAFRAELEQGATALAGLMYRDLSGTLPMQGRKVRIGTLWLLGEKMGGLGIYTQPEEIAFPGTVVDETGDFVTVRIDNSPAMAAPAYGVHLIRRNLIHTLKPAT